MMPCAWPIEYGEQGVGIPLLSIHGAGGGFDQGLANAAELAGDGFRIIAPSRFGYLRTPVPQDVSPAAQADAHSALLSRLNIPKAIVVGVSAGARSAVELALRHPEKVSALVLTVPGLYSPDDPVSIEPSRATGLPSGRSMPAAILPGGRPKRSRPRCSSVFSVCRRASWRPRCKQSGIASCPS
jgi:pimeloyl-ACP methyl ester carboxylesterase